VQVTEDQTRQRRGVGTVSISRDGGDPSSEIKARRQLGHVGKHQLMDAVT